MDAFVIGLGLGFLVSLQLGPLSLFLIRSTLRTGLPTGLAIGLGIACVDALYAAAGMAGAASLLAIDALRLTLGVVGVTVLVVLGVRSLYSAFRVQTGNEIPADVASPRRAFLTSLGATASNPLTIVSWAGVFAAVTSVTAASPLVLVAGVGLGSLAWVCVLAGVVAVVRRSVGRRGIRFADALAGLGMLGFAGALGYRVAD